MTHPLIAAALAAPLTHRVVTTYEGGRTRHHDTRSASTAESYAVGERRKIGRDLIDRDSGATVRVASVSVGSIKQGELAASYAATIGYDPFADDPTITVQEVRDTLEQHGREGARA